MFNFFNVLSGFLSVQGFVYMMASISFYGVCRLIRSLIYGVRSTRVIV